MRLRFPLLRIQKFFSIALSLMILLGAPADAAVRVMAVSRAGSSSSLSAGAAPGGPGAWTAGLASLHRSPAVFDGGLPSVAGAPKLKSFAAPRIGAGRAVGPAVVDKALIPYLEAAKEARVAGNTREERLWKEAARLRGLWTEVSSERREKYLSAGRGVHNVLRGYAYRTLTEGLRGKDVGAPWAGLQARKLKTLGQPRGSGRDLKIWVRRYLEPSQWTGKSASKAVAAMGDLRAYLGLPEKQTDRGLAESADRAIAEATGTAKKKPAAEAESASGTFKAATVSVRPLKIDAEMARSAARRRELVRRLDRHRGKRAIADLRGASAREREQIEDVLQKDLFDLRRNDDRLDFLDKLSSRSDLEKSIPTGEAKGLDALLEIYDDIMGTPARARGRIESEEFESAKLEDLRKRLADLLAGKDRPAADPAGAAAPLAGTPKERGLADRVDLVERLKAQAQAELAQREAAAQLMALADRMRGGALRRRRDERDMTEFRKNFSRLAMVMDLSYSLNVLQSAESAIKGMAELVDRKLEDIEAQRARSKEALERARRNGARGAEWDEDVRRKIAKDEENEGLFTKLGRKAGRLVSRLEEYRTDVPGLIEMIDVRDRGRSSGAVSEYERRITLLPRLQEYRRNGYPDDDGSVSKISLVRLESEIDRIVGYLRDVEAGESRLDSVPLEFAGVLVIAVPGIPPVSVVSPTADTALAVLRERREFWLEQRTDFSKLLDSVVAALGGSTARVLDDFGDSVPESLRAYLDEERGKLREAKKDADRFAGLIDDIARTLSASASGSLPPLSGLGTTELRTVLPDYVDKLDALTFSDTDEGTDAKIDKLGIARFLPFMGDAVIRWAEAEAKSEIIEEALGGILPKAQTRFQDVVDVIDTVLTDIDADKSFIAAGFPASGAQALIDRKRRLVTATLKPMLLRMRDFLREDMIPFQRDQIESVDPNTAGDSLATLYKEKANLYRRIVESYEVTVPWSLASQGAKPGDTAGARANISAQRETFAEYQQLVVDFQDEIRRRKDPNSTEMEDVFGESMPFSLVRRIPLMREETARRAPQINGLSAEIHTILAEIDRRTNGRHGLMAGFRLPTDIRAPDNSSAARLRSLIDSGKIQTLAEVLRGIADEALSASEDSTLDIGGTQSGIPTGEQPPLKLSDSQHIAILALDAVKRLLPSTVSTNMDSLTEAIARYLFTDGVANASQESLDEQIPLFEAFLTKGERALARVFADLDADLSYVSSPTTPPAALFRRKIDVFSTIRETADDGARIFRQKIGWDKESFDTVEDIRGYYDSLDDIYGGSGQALDAEVRAAQKYKEALENTLKPLLDQKKTVLDWLKQLNDPHESALRRVADNLASLQEGTRRILESNIHFQRSKGQFNSASERLKKTLKALEREQGGLRDGLEGIDLDDLSPNLAQRIDDLGLGGPAWLASSPRGPQSLIIKKSQFANFLDQLFGHFDAQSSSRDVVRLREELLKNPLALAQLLPNSKMLELGDDPNGFYLVYNTAFSTPHGLETESQITLGNALRLGNNNVSVIGHRFVSSPSPGNAPFGDQGVTVRVESLQGANWVNYLDVTFHKFIQDIPDDIGTGSQVAQSRMMVFEDFAIMLAGDKLYFGATGFGDFALQDGKNKPYYYGGHFKSSIKFNKVMSVTAEESILFAKDPRRFLQTMNLDFTGYDPTFDRDFVVDARGDNKSFRRDKLGLELNLQEALKTADSFQLDLFGTNISGTDDIDQRTLGATILKGFAFKVGGIPVKTTVSGTGELGTQYNTGSLRVSFELPNQGIVLSADAKFLGDAKTYLLEARKKFGNNTEAFLSWGSRYVGINHRLTLGVNSVFTLGQLWRNVAGETAEDLLGGRTLEQFNKDLVDFFEREDPSEPLLAELRRVFDADIGRRIVSLEIGRLTRDINDLRNAGAILDNAKIRGMVGFVSNPVGDDMADRAAGGGFQVGTQTELTMTKTQKALIRNKLATLFAGGLRLQVRLLELTKRWQEAVIEILESRWERELALFMELNAPNVVIARKGRTLRIEAEARHRQAQLRYNLLTGRMPDSAVPFDSVNPSDMDELLSVLGRILARPDRLSRLFGRLDPSQLPQPEESFNLMDWIPWIERLTFTVGVQLQDLLANQILGASVAIRLPVYDPHSKLLDKSLVLQSRALISDMLEVYGNTRLRALKEVQEAAAFEAQVQLLAQAGPQSAKVLWDAIRRYRNGLMGVDGLWASFTRWHWTVTNLFDARARAALSRAWAVLDWAQGTSAFALEEERGRSGTPPLPARDLDSAMSAIAGNSRSLEALARRSEAVAELLKAANHRIEKVTVDINLGLNVTADGVAWIPALGMTGFGIYPIVTVRMKPEELRSLSVKRREGEEKMLRFLARNLDAELAYQFFSAYTSYRGVQYTQQILNGEVLPELERNAAGGDSTALLKLAQTRAQTRALRAQENSLLITMNYLLGKPADARLELQVDPEEVLAQLRRRYVDASPLEARLGVLRERVDIARKVETIVDKNLKVQDLRIEPISLIGRSLGRLVAALSGSGDASPELVALARHQTLEAERDLRAFERNLPAVRARWSFELERASRRYEEVRYRVDALSKIETGQLRTRIARIRGQMAMLEMESREDGDAGAAGLPSTFAQLENRLIAAFQAETPSAGIGGSSGFVGLPAEAQRLTANGTLRYYNARMSIGKTPIGEEFIEGWVEIRLKSRTTPPEALLALAGLQEEKADQIHKASIARASGRARILLARLRLNTGLLRWVREEGRGRAQVNRLWLEELESAVREDLNEVASHLGLRRDVRTDSILALIPREEASPQESARVFLRTVRETNIEALRSALFEKGLPEEFSGAGDTIVQLKANLIAEKMSFKGFTPVGAIGMFRGHWVSGAFLEAPDPKQIEKRLKGILADALRQELETQERLKSLSLKLHALMASVIDKARLLEAQQARLEAAKENLAGTLVLFERGQSTFGEVNAAQRAAVASWTDFVDTLSGLRIDFVYLVTELKALGQPSFGARSVGRALSRGSSASKIRRKTEVRTVSDLAAYLSRRLDDADFSAKLDELFDGKGVLSETDRVEIARLAGVYREVREAAETVRFHRGFDASEKLDLLTRLDVEGKRLHLEGALREAFRRLRSQGPGWSQLNAFLLEDIGHRVARSVDEARTQRNLMSGMRRMHWESGGYSPALNAMYARVEALRTGMLAARQALLASYVRGANRPEDFLLKDMALDRYLKAVIEFDRGVLAAYSSVEVRGSPAAAGRLNELFLLRESLERRRTLLRSGRAVLAADALIDVESAHLDGLRWRRANRSEKEPVAQRLAFLRSLRDSWLANPRKIRSLYAVVDSEERVARWLTREDLKGLERAKRIVTVEDERWLLPAEHAGARGVDGRDLKRLGARRIVAGADGIADEISEAKIKLRTARSERNVGEALKDSEFVMVDGSGRPVGGLTLEEMRRLEAQGRVLYFSRKKDSTRLRRALHPIAARRKPPAELIVVIAPEGHRGFGHYSSWEALAHSPEAAEFKRLHTGAKGLRRLIVEAEQKSLRARQLGWINLKLEAYAFAVDENGRVVAAYMSAEELEAARREIAESKEEDDPRSEWTLRETGDLEWGVAEDGTLASVRIPSMDWTVPLAGTPVSWISGDILAVELDARGALVRIFSDKEHFDDVSSKWWIEDMSGRLWKQEDFKISPTHRLKRYIDNRKPHLPVLLGRSILARRFEEAKDELGDVGRWAYMPWNWANIVLETPRGILKTPIELITGRDPNQHGYIGRVYMYRTDGGATDRRGPLGKIVHFLDIFELLPDPVDRYMDPSQFPEIVENDSPLLPGEWEHEKNPRTDTQEIHFGKGSLLRHIRYAAEDIEDARSRILGAFSGGVRQTYIETVRGRAGTYPNARIDHRVGSDAVDRVLREMGGLVGPSGTGTWEVDPGHIEVDRVRAETQIRLGARQYEMRAERLRLELENLPPGPSSSELAVLVGDVERFERKRVVARRRREAATALATVGPPLKDAVARSAFPYLTLSARFLR